MPPSCPVCGNARFNVEVPSDQLSRESALRTSFVEARLDHKPDAPELMDLTRFMHGGSGRLLSCTSCGLITRDEEKAAHYETDVYDPDLLHELYPRYQRAFGEKALYKSLLPVGAEILEVGSHLGAFLQTAEEWGWRPTGLDIGVASSTFARRQGTFVKRLPLENYSSPDRSDAIFIWNCFEQLDDPTEVLRSSYRLLKTHGLLVVRVPNARFYRHQREQLRNRQSARPLKRLAYNNLLGFPYHYGYTPAALDRLLIANGFSPLEGHSSNLLTPPYPKMSRTISEEWRSLQREARESPVSEGPWIEIVSRRINDAGSEELSRSLE